MVPLQAIDNAAKMQQSELSAPAYFAMRNSAEDERRRAELREQVSETEKIKAVDPDEERQRKEQERKKRQKEQQGKKNRGPQHGRFIDFTA